MNAKCERDFEKLLSWARYLHWANLLHQRTVDSAHVSESLDDVQLEWYEFALTSQWLASMWVVIEGWKSLGMKDEVINSLLEEWPTYPDLLRRYRNCVFHYQPTLFDERYAAFSKEGLPLMLWVFNLHLEFQRFLWEWPERLKGTKDEIQRVREDIGQIIGWMPTEIIPARKRDVQNLCLKAIEMVQSSGDYDSPAAKDLLDSVYQALTLVADTPDTPMLDLLRGLREIHDQQ